MSSNEMDENRMGAHVLYELLVYKEWELDREKQRKISKNSLLTTKRPRNLWMNILWSVFNRVPWPEEDLAKAGSLLLPWQISVSPNGKFVAILEDSVLELRQSKDEYTSVVGRASVPKDERSQLRKMTWSPDSNMIAVASSDGSVRIYDCCGSLVFKIPLLSPEKPVKKLITGLEFINAREKKGEWELLIIYSNGILECYNISSIDKCTLDHVSVLSETGISCTSFSPQYGILFASVKPLSLLSFENKNFSTGITAWRLLNEAPYYVRVFPTDDELSIYKIHGKMWKLFSLFSSSDCICKIIMAPNNEYLATLHASGIVFIWFAPSLRLHSSLDKFDFKKQKVLVSLSETSICSHVIDIEWRKDSKLIVAWKNGTISIHDVNSYVVLTYFGPDFLHSLPRLASASSLHGFLALECETENVQHPSSMQYSSPPSSPGSENDFSFNDSRIKYEDSSCDEEKTFLDTTSELFYFAMYMITDLEKFEPKRKSIKFIQKTFRLLGVKMTTPEELFERYLKNEEFDRAFEICQEYGLDVAKVYMRQWRTSEVNEHSITEYLANVEDDDWVLNECLQCVPETLSGAKMLIEFGLNFTDIKSILDAQRTTELSDKHKTFVIARLQLLNYAHKLQTYELIFDENSYNVKDFEKFRKQTIVSSTVDFARSAQTEAVKLLMTYHGKYVLPYWLNILDNFPESFKPSLYRDLLPECDGDGVAVQWPFVEPDRKLDWAELEYASLFSDHLPVEETKTFHDSYSFDAMSLSMWYRKRAIALEEYCTIVENAVELLELGITHNIKDLEELLHEFQMLSTLVYDLNMNITYKAFHNEELANKLQMFIKEPENFVDAVLKWVHPYLEYYATKNSSTWLELYRDFMIFNSKRIFEHVVEYFIHIMNGNLGLIGSPVTFLNVLVDCVYAYERFDQLSKTEALIIDTLGWLRSLSEEIRKPELFDKLFAVENELKGAKILLHNGFLTPVSTINKIKLNLEDSKKFVANFTHNCLQNFESNIQLWEDFLTDLVDLQRYCFTSVPLQYCYQIYISEMLRSGSSELIAYTPKILCCSRSGPEEHLSFEMSVQIVLNAAERYFNSALMQPYDNNMHLAKTCLLLIKDDHPLIKEELDLILAVRLLYDLKIHILPLQVRQTKNKMKLIDICFEKIGNIYQNPHAIYKLASKLHIFDSSKVGDESPVTLRLASEAFRRNDYEKCAEYCNDLITNHYQEGWKICMNLAECKNYSDIFFKKKLIVFSMLHAPARMLPHILKIRRLCEKDYLCSIIQNLIELDLTTELNQTSTIFQAIKDIEKILVTSDSKDILAQFSELWKEKFIHCLTHESSKDFIIVCPEYHVNAQSETCNFFSYLEKKETGMEDKILQLVNLFLKLIVLSSSDGVKPDFELFSEVFVTCAILSASKDSTLSLSYLLCLRDPKASEQFFSFFNESSLFYQYQLYYLALKDQNASRCAFSESPREVVSKFLKEGTNKQCLNIYKKLLIDFKNYQEASQVTSLEKGIDVKRFKIDEKYKNDTIFGLALNEDRDSLYLAIDLAQKNDIPIHEVVISHLISLLINNGHANLNNTINDSIILETLAKNQEESLQRMIDTWPSLCGTNYQQQLSFFNIVKSINNEYKVYDLTPKEHISLLKKIKSLPKDIDYKKLVSAECELRDVLKPIMNDENVFLIAKFIKSLPSSIRTRYQVGMFFCQWGIEEFHKKCMNVSFKQCILNFESLNKYFSRCSDEELKFFINNTLFDKESSKNIDSEIRKQLVTLLVNWCESNNSSGQYKSVLQYLHTNLDLINKLWDEEYEDFSIHLKNVIFSIEEHFRNSGNVDYMDILHEALLNLSLTNTDLVYIHKISGIETTLFNIVQKYAKSPKNAQIGLEWMKRFGWKTSDLIYSEEMKNVQGNDEDELIKCFIDSMKKIFNKEIGDKVFTNLNLKDQDSCSNFFEKIMALSTTISHLDAIYTFVQEMPNSLSCDKNDIQLKILKSIQTMTPNSEPKYSLTRRVLKTCKVPAKVFEDLLSSIPQFEPKTKLFMYWTCYHADSDLVQLTTNQFIKDEDENISAHFSDLPKIAIDQLIPNLFKTDFYDKLMNVLKTSAENETIMNCIDALENALSLKGVSTVQTEIVRLKLYISGNSLGEKDIPPPLKSFYTQLTH